MTPRPKAPCPPLLLPPAQFEAEGILASVRARVQRQQHNNHAQQLPECPIAPRELPPGTQVQGYTLEQVLGSGGFAVTYLAREEASGKRVVLKEHFPECLYHRKADSLHVQALDDAWEPACIAAHEGFLREHRLLSTLEHPQIPRASSCFEAYNTSFFATEHIEGCTLGELREQCTTHCRTLPQQETYATLVRLLDVLSYLHDQELLHRDIKPENILINREGLPMLIDFGAAHKLGHGAPAYTVEAPGFSPAEQSHHGGKLDPWSDLYALGATFHYLLTGRPLPPGRQRELVDTATPLTHHRHLRAHYHPRLLASIDRATRPHARDRYQRAEHWLADLRG